MSVELMSVEHPSVFKDTANYHSTQLEKDNEEVKAVIFQK